MGKYKVLNVYLLFGAVPNAQIAYGSPDIYKMMKETKSILFFDNLDNCKIVDIPLAIKRKNQKKKSKNCNCWKLHYRCEPITQKHGCPEGCHAFFIHRKLRPMN